MTELTKNKAAEIRAAIQAYRYPGSVGRGRLNDTADEMRRLAKDMGWTHGCGVRPDDYAEAAMIKAFAEKDASS